MLKFELEKGKQNIVLGFYRKFKVLIAVSIVALMEEHSC